MKSFFSRFKGNFGTDLGGRYFSSVLVEVMKENKSFVKFIFPSLSGKAIGQRLSFVTEYPLSISKDNGVRSDLCSKCRRADIAVLDSKNKVVALIEVKCEDDQHEGQIEDYVNFTRKLNVPFTCITQYLDQSNLRAMRVHEKCAHLLYDDIYKWTCLSENKDNFIIKLFKEFIVENYMVYECEISREALMLLTFKGLHLKNSTGFGRKNSSENFKQIPVVWDRLMGNMTVLGDEFYCRFSEFFNNRMSLDFWFDPSFKLKLLHNLPNDKDDVVAYIPRSKRAGGVYYVGVQGKVKQDNSDDYLYIYFGYEFAVSLDGKLFDSSILVGVSGKSCDACIKRVRFDLEDNRLPGENDCFRMILDGACSSIYGFIQQNNGYITQNFRQSLNSLSEKVCKCRKQLDVQCAR